MAEMETFDEMLEVIQGAITFGVKQLTTKAVPRKLITRGQKREIDSPLVADDQAARFVNVIGQKIEHDPAVMDQLLKMLSEVGIYEKLVNDINTKLMVKRANALPSPPESTEDLKAELLAMNKEPANGTDKEAPMES